MSHDSIFHFTAHYEQIWLRLDEEPPESRKDKIQDKKIIMTI
jgi:hypothetical protein